MLTLPNYNKSDVEKCLCYLSSKSQPRVVMLISEPLIWADNSKWSGVSSAMFAFPTRWENTVVWRFHPWNVIVSFQTPRKYWQNWHFIVALWIVLKSKPSPWGSLMCRNVLLPDLSYGYRSCFVNLISTQSVSSVGAFISSHPTFTSQTLSLLPMQLSAISLFPDSSSFFLCFPRSP